MKSLHKFLSLLLILFALPGCSSLTKKGSLQPGRDLFTDVDLKNYLQKNASGIIYVFSPRMPLSLLGLEEARGTALSHGVSFLALLDPMETNSQSSKDPRYNHIPILASKELIRRNATQHFPAKLFYKDQKLTGSFNPGYETPDILGSNLKKFLTSKTRSKDINFTQKFDEVTRAPAEQGQKPLGFIREIHLPIEPTYFIRVDTDTKKLYMSGDCVASLISGQCLSTGRTWEPYPVAGFNILSIPGCETIGGMCFYDGLSYRSQDKSAPIYIDPELKGYYQSIGFLSQSRSEARVRFITYYGFMRDYIVRKGYVAPLGPIKKFCGDRNLLKLPMLSKDGKYLSGWDSDIEKTIIFSLSEKGECKEVYSTDVMVSKMDWSYDGKFVAFHISTNRSGKVSEDTSGELVDQQIFLMNLESKKVRQLSFGPELQKFLLALT